MPADIAATVFAAPDRLRAETLRWLSPWVRPYLADRPRRVALWASVSIGAALALAALSPLWLLALSPVLLGVPHLAADFRYLVARPALHRRPELWIAVGLPLLAAAIWPWAWVALLAPLGALAVARGDPLRRAAAALPLLALMAAAWSHGFVAIAVLAHAHNLVALWFWWHWRKRSGAGPWIALALWAAGSAFLLSGAADPLYHLGVRLLGPRGDLGLDPFLRMLAPGLSAGPAFHLAVWFAFAQAVHYGVWLRLVPEDDRPRPSPRPFRASWRALRADLSAPVLWGFTALAAGIALWAAFDLCAARDGYLRFVFFHGPLELAVALLFWAERRPATQ